MTPEERYIGLINYTVKSPYAKTPRQLAFIFGLKVETVYELGKKLALDIIGRKSKNNCIDAEILIRYHPELTASQIAEMARIKLWVVYKLGRKMNHRFETKHSQRRIK